MSTKSWEERITTRYTEPEKDIYQQVIDLVKKNSLPKSTAQLLLVKRGLEHVSNPEPLIKTIIKEVPVEKIKTVIKEVPVEKVVYKSPPKVDKPTPQEHVGVDDHIIDEPVKADPQNARQRASADELTTLDKADPPSPSTALEEEKSAPKENGVSGWAVAGGLGLVSLLVYLIFK